MSHILHLDASARPGIAGTDHHGAHSRQMSHHFVSQWQSGRPGILSFLSPIFGVLFGTLWLDEPLTLNFLAGGLLLLVGLLLVTR